MYGMPHPFSDTFHGHGNIPITAKVPLIVAYMFFQLISKQ